MERCFALLYCQVFSSTFTYAPTDLSLKLVLVILRVIGLMMTIIYYLELSTNTICSSSPGIKRETCTVSVTSSHFDHSI